MSRYCYFPLAPESGTIRLLRLLPNKNDAADLRCELFEYTLHDSDKATYPYEALSYVWGSSDETQSILIDNQYLRVTLNLHTALLRLRDRDIPRILWVDAICINQVDDQEKEHQILSMAKIYAKASRVLVWLGESAGDSDRALNAILAAGSQESGNLPNEDSIQDAILALLRRPWFRRIWVLQEVAAARHVLISCGSTEIDGYAFCLGMERLQHRYKALPGFLGQIQSVTYLIRGAIFRPGYRTNTSGRVSLDICLLGELLDMYHTHDATKRHDKVYALLGMSSDDLREAGLSPDYSVPWGVLLERLIKFLLGNELSAQTWDDEEIAVIEAKGCVVGHVTSIESDQDGGQSQKITYKNTSKRIWDNDDYETQWTLQSSAKPVRKGDLICLLYGASKPTIIRGCKDHFSIVMILASLQPEHPISSFTHNFLLVWDWGKLDDLADYETLIKIRAPEHSNGELPDHSDIMTRLWNLALILGDAKEYRIAEERLQEAEMYCKSKLGEHDPRTLTYGRQRSVMRKKAEQYEAWKKLEEAKKSEDRSGLRLSSWIRDEWIVQLRFKQGDQLSLGTGFYIQIPDVDKYVILTAGQNLIDGNRNLSTGLEILQATKGEERWTRIEKKDLQIFISASYTEMPDPNSNANSNYGAILLPKQGHHRRFRGFGFALKLGYDDLNKKQVEVSGYTASSEPGGIVTSSGECSYGAPMANDLIYRISTMAGQSGSPVIMPYKGHDTVVAIQISGSRGHIIESKGIRLNERVLGDIFGWAGVIHKNKSVKAFQSQPESSRDMYLRFPPDHDCAWVRLGTEGLETSFDIFPAYASSSSSNNTFLYVFRFHLPPNWPGPKEKRWVVWDAVQQRVTLTSNLQQSCFARIMRNRKRDPENFHIVVEIPEGELSGLWELRMQAMNLSEQDIKMGNFDTPEVSFQKYVRHRSPGLRFE